MSAGDVAGLIAAVAFVLLVAALAYPLVKLGRLIEEGTARVRQTGATIDEGTARVRQAGETVGEVNALLGQVSSELQRVDAITANVQSVTGNLSALTSLFAATLGGPVIKAAAFTYGVRRAAGRRARADVEARITDTMKQEKALEKAGRRTGEGS